MEKPDIEKSGMHDHPNAVLARELWEATSKSDASTIMQLLAPGIIWRTYGGGALGGLSEGPEAVLNLLARAGELVDQMTMRVVDIFASDQGAVIHYIVEANQGPKSLDMQVVLVMYIESGRVTDAFTVPTHTSEDNAFWRLQ